MENIKWVLNTKTEPQGSSDGFWYDLTDGGYITPSILLKDDKQLKMVEDAVEVLLSFQKAIEEAGLLNEF